METQSTKEIIKKKKFECTYLTTRVRINQKLPGCIKINSNSIEDRMYFSLSGQEQNTTQRQMGKLTDTFDLISSSKRN
jgi:hypothetical protein